MATTTAEVLHSAAGVEQLARLPRGSRAVGQWSGPVISPMRSTVAGIYPGVVCWWASAEVVLVDDKRQQSSFALPDDLHGDPPRYWFGVGCACDLIEGGGTSVPALMPGVGALLAQPATERIAVGWGWGWSWGWGDPPTASQWNQLIETRMSLPDFEAVADGQVALEQRYRISDPARWSIA